MEAAGVIDEIGPGTDTDLNMGDGAMAIVVPQGSHGAYSEYVVLPASSVVKTPAGTNLVAAATLPMNALAARQALDLLDLTPGRTIAVTGAAGMFGGYVVQLAKADGLTVIADASEADEELVRSFGADTVVRRGDDIATHIRQAVPDGVDAVVDGSVQRDLLVSAVRDGGAIVSARRYLGPADRGVRWLSVWVPDYANAHQKLDALRRQVENGQLTPRVADTLPADKAPDAHRRLEAGGIRGRIVLTF